jgi:nucleotide-binding universal stress UspA family protein
MISLDNDLETQTADRSFSKGRLVMTTLELEKSVTFKNILAATDFSDASRHALEWAASITGSTDGKLFLLNVLPAEARLPVTFDPFPKALDRAGCEADLEFQKLVSSKSIARVSHETLVRRGPVADVVSDLIEEMGIDLLVTGSQGRKGLGRVVLGSVAEELLRRASCPVLTVGPYALSSPRMRRVVYATDFGAASHLALPYALDFANTEGGELLLLHIVAPVPIDYFGPGWYSGSDLIQYELEAKQQSIKKLRSLLPEDSQRKCLVEHIVQSQMTAEGILKVAREREADLIVLGVHESGAGSAKLATHLPWTTIHEIVCQAECAVLTVKA